MIGEHVVLLSRAGLVNWIMYLVRCLHHIQGQGIISIIRQGEYQQQQ